MHYIAREYAPDGELWIILETFEGEVARFRLDRHEGRLAWYAVMKSIATDGESLFMQRKDGSGGYIFGSLDQIAH